jgi:hypothetical protein
MLFKHLGVKEDHSVMDFEVVEVVVMDHHEIRLIETMQSVPIVENQDTTNLNVENGLKIKVRSNPLCQNDRKTMEKELAISDELISPSFPFAVCKQLNLMLLF